MRQEPPVIYRLSSRRIFLVYKSYTLQGPPLKD